MRVVFCLTPVRHLERQQCLDCTGWAKRLQHPAGTRARMPITHVGPCRHLAIIQTSPGKAEDRVAGAVASIKATATAEDAALPPPPPKVTDMSDSWRAKVTVSLEQQADCGKLAAVYDGMRAAFRRDGLNPAAIRATLCARPCMQGPACLLLKRNLFAVGGRCIKNVHRIGCRVAACYSYIASNIHACMSASLCQHFPNGLALLFDFDELQSGALAGLFLQPLS